MTKPYIPELKFHNFFISKI